MSITRRGPRTGRARVLVVAALAAVVAVVALAGLGLGLLDDGDGTEPRVRFAPRPRVLPGDGLAWWAPVRGEPLGVAVEGADVAAAALDEVRLLDGASGRVRWKASVPGVRQHRPAVAGDRVVVTGETELVLLDRADGATIARVPFAGPGPAALLDVGGLRIAAAGAATGELLAVDVAAGAPRWSVTYPGEVATAPRAAAGTVLASWHHPDGATLRALDPATGATRWERALGPVASAPALHDGAVVVAHGEGIHAAVAEALDVVNGAPRWQVPLPGWWDPALEHAVDAATVYLVDGMGTVVALDPATGTSRWRSETGRPLLQGRLALTPGAVVFASNDDELLVLDRADGRLRSAEPQGGVPVDVAGGPERLVVALRLGSPSRVEARPVP